MEAVIQGEGSVDAITAKCNIASSQVYSWIKKYLTSGENMQITADITKQMMRWMSLSVSVGRTCG